MSIRNRFSVYAFVSPNTGFYSQQTLELGDYLDSVSFGSAAPGGFTTFEAVLRLPDARLFRPVFALMSEIAVMDYSNAYTAGAKNAPFGPAVWRGELTDVTIGMDQTLGEYVRLTALGLGNGLRDDPRPVAYAAQTPQQMVVAELNARTVSTSKLQTISSDTAQIFPDNPATQYSPVYDNRTMEEVIADVCSLAGDYQWGVWAHPTQRNAAGFPLGQLVVHKRDTTTTTYVASIAGGDIQSYQLTPSAERAYNRITVDYTTASGGVGTATYTDSRLNGATLAQANAPFRYRKLSRDYSGTSTITATQAQAIANAYGALYKDVSNKISFTLRSVNDANGRAIPLWQVMADNTIFVPDFAQRSGTTLPTSPTPGVNQFYIVAATYRVDQSGQETVELQCDNWVDQVESQIARLTLAADVQSRTKKTTGYVQAQGAAASGYTAIGQSNAVSGQACTGLIQFPVQLYQSPVSIAFTAQVTTNIGAPSVSRITTLGAVAQAIASASGAVQGAWTYTTSGNCIRRVGRKLFDWHCDGCGKELRGLALARHVRVETALGTTPGLVALAIDCPECGAGEQPFTESFNTALTAVDEDVTRGRGHGHHPFRAEQARLIRALMRSGPVGLDTLL